MTTTQALVGPGAISRFAGQGDPNSLNSFL
jgi:hypothetical protein